MKGRSQTPTLAEDLLLLALHDDDGKVVSEASLALNYGLAGALLAELLMMGRLRLDGRERLEVVDGSPTGDSLFDEALGAIGRNSRGRTLRQWVAHFGGGQRNTLRQRLLTRLVGDGVLREEEGRFLWIFPIRRYPEQDSAPEQRVRERLRVVVLGGVTPDERTLTLLGLVKACRLVGEVFPNDDREIVRRRVDELTEGEAASRAVTREVRAVQAAIFAAITASTTSVVLSPGASSAH